MAIVNFKYNEFQKIYQNALGEITNGIQNPITIRNKLMRASVNHFLSQTTNLEQWSNPTALIYALMWLYYTLEELKKIPGPKLTKNYKQNMPFTWVEEFKCLAAESISDFIKKKSAEKTLKLLKKKVLIVMGSCRGEHFKKEKHKKVTLYVNGNDGYPWSVVWPDDDSGYALPADLDVDCYIDKATPNEQAWDSEVNRETLRKIEEARDKSEDKGCIELTPSESVRKEATQEQGNWFTRWVKKTFGKKEIKWIWKGR